MQISTTSGRWLARAAGFLAGGAAIYVLTQDAIRTGHWTTDDMLMPVLVVLTILASHLVGTAIRARAAISVAGFVAMAMIGTALIVYTSVGRQAHIADTEDAKATATAHRIEAVEAEISRVTAKRIEAEAMLDGARARLAAECASGKGRRCKGVMSTADTYEAAVKGHDADLNKLRAELAGIGPAPVTGAKATRMASVIAVFFADETAIKARLARIFRLFEPFAYSLFWELGALVALGFGFGHGKARPTIAERMQTSFPSGDMPDATMFSGRQPLPENDPPAPPRGGKRCRQTLPANVVPFGKHPVIAALENAGGSVASNRELASLMGCHPGESTKRVREVADQLDLVRVGKEKRISLKRARKSA